LVASGNVLDQQDQKDDEQDADDAVEGAFDCHCSVLLADVSRRDSKLTDAV
jgi:hypothetical protein